MVPDSSWFCRLINIWLGPDKVSVELDADLAIGDEMRIVTIEDVQNMLADVILGAKELPWLDRFKLHKASVKPRKKDERL